jgi:hypothetical protein
MGYAKPGFDPLRDTRRQEAELEQWRNIVQAVGATAN